MKAFKHLATVALAVATFGAGALVIARAQDVPRGDAANGKRVYLGVGCFTCHGRSGQGGAFTGPAPILARTALPFDGFKALIRAPSSDIPGPIPMRCCRTGHRRRSAFLR